MAIPTVRMPDDTHDRLRHLAKARKVSMNKLIEASSIAALVAVDAEARFRARATRWRNDIAPAPFFIPHAPRRCLGNARPRA